MKLYKALDVIESKPLQIAVMKQLLWQHVGTLCFKSNSFARAEMNAHRSKTAKKAVDEFNQTRDNFWGLFAKAAGMGLEYDYEEEVLKQTKKAASMPNDAEMQKLAECSGYTLARVREMKTEEYRADAAKSDEKYNVAISLIKDGEFLDVDYEDNVEERVSITAEKLSDVAVNHLEWLMKWKKPDFGAIMIVKADLATIKTYVEMEENVDETEEEEIGLSGELSMQEKAYMRIVNG